MILPSNFSSSSLQIYSSSHNSTHIGSCISQISSHVCSQVSCQIESRFWSRWPSYPSIRYWGLEWWGGRQRNWQNRSAAGTAAGTDGRHMLSGGTIESDTINFAREPNAGWEGEPKAGWERPPNAGWGGETKAGWEGIMKAGWRGPVGGWTGRWQRPPAGRERPADRAATGSDWTHLLAGWAGDIGTIDHARSADWTLVAPIDV